MGARQRRRSDQYELGRQLRRRPGLLEPLADWAVRNLWATLVVSAGDAGYAALCGGSTEDQKVSAPGLAWSVITVGSVDDGDGGFWSGDAMTASRVDSTPTSPTGMEKPEVVAVGEDVLTTDDAGGGWITPWPRLTTPAQRAQVSGQVALMLEPPAQPSTN